MKTEPVLTVASVTAAVAAVIALAVSFGFEVSDDQTAAILGVVAVVGPLVAAVVQRRQVVPSGRVVEMDGGDGTVVAGEANEIPTGVLVRDDLGVEPDGTADREALDALVSQPRRGRDDDGDGRPDVAGA